MLRHTQFLYPEYPLTARIVLSGSDANEVCLAGVYKSASAVDAAAGGQAGEEYAAGASAAIVPASGIDLQRRNCGIGRSGKCG